MFVESAPPPPHNGTFPYGTLHNGDTIPLVGLGCASGVRQAHVASALQVGYRSLDTAQSYNWGYHEHEVGNAVEQWQKENGDDPTLFVQTKIHPEHLGYHATKKAVQVSLQRLKTTRLDSVLIHKPRCWEGACRKQPEGTWEDSWKALEELVDEGVIRSIGICDVTDPLLDELIQKRIKPHVIQNWMDPFHQTTRLRKRCQEEKILFQAYSSLGTQWVHHRGYKTNPVLTNPTLVAIAEKYDVGVAQVIINWGTRHGISMLPASTNADRQKSNLDSFGFDLTEDELTAIDDLDGKVPTPPQKDANEVSIVFENKHDMPINSFWVSDAEEIHVGSIEAGRAMTLTSFHGHKFVFRDRKGSVIGQHTVAREAGQEQRHVVHGEL